MKLCGNCGSELPEGVRNTCPYCKTPISRLDESIFPTVHEGEVVKSEDDMIKFPERSGRPKKPAPVPEAELGAPIVPKPGMEELSEAERAKVEEAKKLEHEQIKSVAAIAYTGILFFMPAVCCPDKRYGRFHSNQGLLILLFLIVGALINRLAALMPTPQLYQIVITVMNAYFGGLVYLILVGIVRALKGISKPLPIIGGIELIKVDPPKERS